jgi:uncharacterized protein YchJ
MSKDRINDRFQKKQKDRKLGELSRKSLTQDEIAAEEELIASAEKVETIHADQAPGRNDPCPCGSGKKYKKCCYGKKSAGKQADNSGGIFGAIKRKLTGE